jgi:hypothetical protein
LTRGNLSLSIDVERVFQFYLDNAKLLRVLVSLRDPTAMHIGNLVRIANEAPGDEQKIVDACLAIEEFRRCLLQ